VFLKSGFDGRLDFLDLSDLIFNQAARLFVEQRYSRAGARGIPGRRNML